ncbi:alpha/beta fold hydrolase [Mesobacterium pallidum]|uniref:alpha/beta fold hydrolase n=1 Tax=Mesobacterium pallidum TaxID=2872037 RepID=UPI001EE35EFB|nr:alpha/beta hydrolase [Mesobacterium pallidum]
MPTLARDDITYHYEDDGPRDAPVILLLAGMFSDSASWYPLVEPLTAAHRVIRPDNRTTGRTTPRDAPCSVTGMAEDAAALLAALDLTGVHVVGHSMGGLQGMELTGLAPERLASLTILASAPVRSPRIAGLFDNLARVRAAPEGEEMWLRALFPWLYAPAFFEDPARTEAALAASRAYPYAQDLASMKHQLEALKGFRPTVRTTEITVPTQAVLADEDILISKAPAAKALATIPGVTLLDLPDAGHSLHWDQPAAVAQIITDFVAAHS